MWAGAGYMATKVTGNFIAPMLPMAPENQPMMRIAIKAGTAYLAAWAGEVLMGQRRVFMPMFLGGAMSAVEDVIKTYVAPTFPMLADDLDIYPPLVGSGAYVSPDTELLGHGMEFEGAVEETEF